MPDQQLPFLQQEWSLGKNSFQEAFISPLETVYEIM